MSRLDENKDPVTALHGFEKFAANENKANLYMENLPTGIFEQSPLNRS